jgi:hypothetical protein
MYLYLLNTWAWWYSPVIISALRRLRLEDQKFNASLYSEILFQKKKNHEIRTHKHTAKIN